MKTRSQIIIRSYLCSKVGDILYRIRDLYLIRHKLVNFALIKDMLYRCGDLFVISNKLTAPITDTWVMLSIEIEHSQRLL